MSVVTVMYIPSAPSLVHPLEGWKRLRSASCQLSALLGKPLEVVQAPCLSVLVSLATSPWLFTDWWVAQDTTIAPKPPFVPLSFGGIRRHTSKPSRLQ